jgi:hypothetical protein
MSQDKIEAVVQEYIGQGKMFTSVDIANEVKKRGTWVRTRQVRDYLHTNVLALSNYSYREEQITVVRSEDGQHVVATLYLPPNESASNYDATNQHAMTPDEFDALHGTAVTTGSTSTTQPMSSVPAVSVPTSTPAPVVNDDNTDPTGVKRAASGFGKFNFPT